MRLKSIKLAGFKSFVDPTTVSFPSNLCAVVGPNGCGKSNIIDAVRWVMGESSAKNLRGEQMTDVIFNGSTNRKPLGQASVELIFDNSDHTVQGEYAGYNEISVRRVVTSDAQSSYYLNATRCRRRDITDLFLGTGLGPRSYSIIEQGMISRLIESKPEELRVFIEEAAGISKYKERRRETENRIKRTKENLERLADIRDELDRQLQHLQRQAASAEKYRELKQEERDLSARLNALRWRSLDQEVTEGQQAIARLEVELEACIAEQRRFDAEAEQKRSDNSDINERYHEIQQRYYGLGSDIARIEQNLEHYQQRRQQLEEDYRQTEESLAAARRELNEDQDKIRALEEAQGSVEPDLEAAREKEQGSLIAQEDAEALMSGWQEEWEVFNREASAASHRAEVEQQRISHLENIVERGSQRRQQLEQEKEGLAVSPEEDEIAELDERLYENEERHSEQEEAISTIVSRIEDSRERQKSLQSSLDRERSTLQTLLGRSSSLEALQQAALQQSDSAVEWLTQQGLHEQPRLVDGLKVNEGWELAVETVLSNHLQAVCVDGLESFAALISDFDGGELNLLDLSAVQERSEQSQSVLAKHRLADQVSSRQQAALPLSGIYCAQDLPEALSLRASLQGNESIITRQGIWLGRAWLRVMRGFDEQAGMIRRQEEIDTLKEDIALAREMVVGQEAELEKEQATITELESERERQQQMLTEINREAAELKADRSGRMMKIEQVRERRKRVDQELTELSRQLAVENDNIAGARTVLQEALDRMEQDSNRKETLQRKRDEHRARLDELRHQARQDRDQAHQLSLQHQTLTAQLSSMRSALARMQGQVQNHAARKERLQESLQELEAPLPGFRDELEIKLSQRLEIEASLTETKIRVDAIEHEIRALEQQRNQAQERSQTIRDALVNHQLSIEGATVKRRALADTIAEAEYDLETVLKNLPDELVESECEQELERIASRVQRLGAINLAAIEEFSTQSERKHYLDAQNDDLEAALNTLENAIRKIDRETRTRFKETFDRVNHGLQELFPKVFGGGHAYLDMVGEDLLDTGVTIMARPPGKKNSTIHLLSGGEKAMTAIALVFSIFRLNPSPFCMLDEVDAPLDDANVGRYARLVEEMSDLVQFIFITHNRITMESAHQLLGVTMHEPGVSRLVTVDVDEAAELAAM